MKPEIFTDGQLRTGYRVDGGAEPYYTYDKKDANREFEEVLDNFYPPAAIWELVEQYDANNDDWDIVEENIIRQADTSKFENEF